MEKINIILFGKPGAGKGTQANFIKENYNLKHLSTGEIFRLNIRNNTDLGIIAQSYINKGGLVPDDLTIKMLEEEVNKSFDTGFLFDGFPRTLEQAKALDSFLGSKNIEITATIGLEADDEILIQRIIERGKTSQRPEDKDEVKIRKRFEEYNDKTSPLIDYYTKQGKFYPVNGIGTIEDVTQRVLDISI
jgi:adenylate kinase